jgi:hypothetical protein
VARMLSLVVVFMGMSDVVSGGRNQAVLASKSQ